jgi:hypothetical protein
MPPKFEIFILFLFQKNLYVAKALKHVLIIWILKINKIRCLFYCAFVCEIQQTPLRKMIFFLNVPHLL